MFKVLEVIRPHPPRLGLNQLAKSSQKDKATHRLHKITPCKIGSGKSLTNG
jgi:hypothetical protein